MRYFYWGPKHVILRPCGKDDFSLSGLNSYLTGFDLRPKHNYYVYATNVISDNDYMKNHDKSITNWLYFLGDFLGDFSKAYQYVYSLVNNMY